MSWQFIDIYRPESLEAFQIGPHTEPALCCVRIGTDTKRRGDTPLNRAQYISTLQKNGIRNRELSGNAYFLALPNYQFVVSPEGQGIDCHRHYEALMAGCIPILEKHIITEALYSDCPVLWTTDYSEITTEYLSVKYEEMLDTSYDFSRLLLRTYPVELQTEIKRCGNFWSRYMLSSTWYPEGPLPDTTSE